MRPALAALATLALLATPGPAGAQPPDAEPKAEPKTNLADISDEVMCPVCGVPLELAQEAPQAEAEREFIRGLIREGKTEEEIKDALVAEYGEDVLTLPGTEGFDLAAWLIPIAGLVTAALLIGITLRRWRAKSGSAEPREGTPDGQPTPDQADSERLDADMARYRL